MGNLPAQDGSLLHQQRHEVVYGYGSLHMAEDQASPLAGDVAPVSGVQGEALHRFFPPPPAVRSHTALPGVAVTASRRARATGSGKSASSLRAYRSRTSSGTRRRTPPKLTQLGEHRLVVHAWHGLHLVHHHRSAPPPLHGQAALLPYHGVHQVEEGRPTRADTSLPAVPWAVETRSTPAPWMVRRISMVETKEFGAETG